MNRPDVTGFVFGTYRHYKGDLYTAIALVTHHATRLPLVLYVSHARGCINCRPLHGWRWDPRGIEALCDKDGFCDPVMINGAQVPRFQLVKEATP